jgi:RHS repeat-associated protein
MRGSRSAALILAGFAILATVSAYAESAAIWAQSSDETAIQWSGSKGEIYGLTHSNGGVRITGSKNIFDGGLHYGTTFFNNKPSGGNANVLVPPAVQVAPQPFPRDYELQDYQPGGAEANGAGASYVDLTYECAANGASGVALRFNGESIPDALYYVPCDILFDAKGSTGNVTIVSTGSIHYKTHNNSQISPLINGLLVFTTSDGTKAIHLNGNKSAMHGDIVAPHGEIHIAGSNQEFSCGVYGHTVKYSGTGFTIAEGDCGNVVPNAPPMAVDDVAATLVGQPVVIDVLANDSDVDGTLDPASVVIVVQPVNGVASVDQATGAVEYTPAPGFFGMDAFEYTVADDLGAVSQPALVSIDVEDVNTPPVANDDLASVREDETLLLTPLQNDSDVDGTIVPGTLTIVNAPSNGTAVVNLADGTVDYTPDPDFNGFDTFNYTVQDNDGAVSNQAAVGITVTAVNDAPVVQSDSAEGLEDEVLLIYVLANDSDVDSPLTIAGVSITSQPTYGSVSIDYEYGALRYTPDPDFYGPDSFQYRLYDSFEAGSADIATVSITIGAVNDAPFAPDAALDVSEDGVVAIELQATDVEGDPVTYAVVGGPSFGALDGTAPNLTYTPALNFFGTDTITYTASDGQDTSTPATITINVLPVNDPPVVDDQTFLGTEDRVLNFTIAASDVDGDLLSYTLVSSPANGTLAGTGPVFAYTPDPDFNGSDTFVVSVSDGNGGIDNAIINFTVGPVNDAPVAAAQTVETVEDTPLAITLQGSDVDGDPLTFAVQSAPANGTLSGAAPDVVYTPVADFNGADSFTFYVNDGSLNSFPATVTITVTAANDAPVADDQSLTTVEDTPLNVTLTGSDIDGDALSFAIASAPANGSVSGVPPSVVYTPAADFDGTDEFTFVANDGATDSPPATIAITVSPVNDAPVANDSVVVTDEDVPAAFILQASDVDGDTLTYSVLQAPTNGSLSGTAPSLTYTPGPDFNGSDALTFSVSDGASTSGTATVSFTINPVNDPPSAEPQSLSTPEDTPLTVVLSGSDPEGQAVNFVIATPPANGALSGAAPNLTYTPATDFNGSDRFSFTTSDGVGTSAPAQVSIVVTPVNDAPVADPITLDAIAGTPIGITLSGQDVDGDTLGFAVTTLPAGGSLDGLPPDLTYTADLGFAGVDQFTYVANDGALDSVPAVVTLNVTDTNTAPVISSSPPTTASVGALYSYQVVATDPDGDPLTYALAAAPTGMTISTSGLVEWTPVAAGTFDVTIEVADDRAGVTPQTFQLIAGDNVGPEFVRIPLLNAPQGELYESAGLAVDPEGDGISVALASGPTGAQLQDNGNGAFELSWPSAGAVGDSVNFEIIATDDRGASTTLNLSVRVTGSRVGQSHLGTDFWAAFGFNYNNGHFGLGAMPLSDPGRRLQILIGAPEGASGVVEIASEGFVQPFTVAAGEALTMDIPTSTMSTNATIRNNGVHVMSDTPITVAGLNWAFATTDAFLVMPVTSLGYDYLVTGYENIIWSHVPPLEETMYSVLAAEDGTTVTITPLAGAPLYADDRYRTPRVVTLNRGEVLGTQIEYVHALSLSADRPIAVFAGSSCADVPNGVSTCDHLWQQFVPDTSLASRYLVAPIATRAASLYRVVANEDDTGVFVNDQYVARLDRGDKFERLLEGPLEIVATRPVAAVQYTPGNQFDKDSRQDDLADPFMLNLAPADAFLADYVFVVPSGEGVLRDQPNNTIRLPIEEHHVSVVIPAAAASSLVLDGVPVDTSAFVPVGSSDYLSGSLPMTPGTHRMAANDPFGLHVYGFGLEESYGYYAGLIFPDGNVSLDVIASGPTGPLTTGSEEACIDIEVRDLGGLLIPRARFQVGITGTVERNYTGFTDSVGSARYCYTQPVAGTDAVTVSVAGDAEVLSVQWLADTDPGTNGRPAFVSIPDLILYDPTYVYDVAVVDPDGDPVTVTVTDGPMGALYSSASEQLTWTPPIPPNRAPTLHSIELTATDPGGLSATQRFEITVYYPPQISQFPTIQFVNLFGGRRETAIEHIGGDDKLIQARVTAGSPGTGISRLDLYDQWTFNISPISFDHLQGIGTKNPMCRGPGAFIGSFRTDERFFDPSFAIPASAAGPAVDTNNDGVVDNLDDIYVFNSERSGVVSLYNLTTRETVWRLTGVGNRHGHQPAFANLDADPDLEFLVAGTQMIALDTDGTELWRSSTTLSTFGNARSMSVVISDLDGDGAVEILYGNQVFNSAGIQLWQSDVAPVGRPNRALPVPADLDGDGEQEVLFGNQVRDTDGTLLWTLDAAAGAANPHAYHAVADVDGDGRLEVYSAVYTSAGPQMIAFDADGNELWSVETQGVTINYAGIPNIADFNNDGELEIFQPTARTLISADGRILSEFDTADGGIVELKILDLNGDGVYETMDGRQEFEYFLSRMIWGTPGSGHGIPFGDYNPFKYVDSDHDGKVELLITSSSGLGLYESQDGSWQLPQRDYRQHLYYDANGFNVDAYAPPNPPDLQPDAWVGELFVNGSLAGGYSFAVDVANRGTANITEDVTVNFYRGIPATGTFLGDVTIAGGLTAGETRTVSIPLARSEFDGMMSVQLTFGGPVEQCETQNDTVAGTFTEVEIFDGPSEYRTDRYSFIYRISEYNRDIAVQSTPPTSVILGQTYVYDANAVAGNFGDNVRYALTAANASTPVPRGAAIETVSGLVTWTPTFDQVGTHTMRVSFNSLVDATSQTFNVEVVPRANEIPVITTTPPSGLVFVGTNYSYDVDATDADGDTLLYELTVAPAGMTIDSATGLVDWTPTTGQNGLHDVTISVDDGFGGVVTQSYAIQVGSTANSPPTITSVPPFFAKATFEYQYQVTVDDPDGDYIAYTVETGPAGMTIDSNGLLSWTPGAGGLENVVIRASDGQAFADQGWTITVSEASVPLEAFVSASPQVADLGTTVNLTVGYTGAAGPVSLSLTVDGVAVPVNASGDASVTADTVGLHTATAIVTDPYSSDSASVTYTVIDPNATSSPPVVSLTSPDFEEEVTAPRDAIGTVTDPDGDLLNWQLILQSRGAPATEFTVLAGGTNEVPNDVLGQIDPTMLLNGLYSVVLQATDAAGNVAQDVRVIRVKGDLKIGNFSITFEDFSAPVAGIPVTVLRTYDTRQRNENLDFGFGWSIDYQNVRLQESRDIGFSWTLIEEDLGFFSQWCVRPNGDPTVTVRLPDGEVETFVARAEPECTQLVPTVDVNIVFEPVDGTDSTLEQTDFGIVRIVGNNIVDLGAPGTPIDPDGYRLTTPEGLVFELDQAFGIRRITEPNGTSLTYTEGGIIHSQGFSLTFVRDGAGRITSINAPDGTSMSYGYDANGDLVSYTDQVQQTTTYTYKLGVEHYLEDIIDPRGIRVSRNEYDADGRLIAIIDADGNRIEYDHDIIGRTETIRDRRGNPTVYIYDDEGNVLLETNALGETITRTYDADRNVLSETNDLGQTTSWTYDERGNELSETNALMQTTTSTYDARNLLLTVVDPLGLPVMTNVYDPNNTNLLTTTNALGNTTTFHWDAAIGTCSTGASRGSTDALLNRTTIQPQCVGPFAELPAWQEDARGVRTSFGYDDVGRVTSETTTRTDEFGIVQTLVTTMEYDDKGRLVRVTDPEGNVTVTEYNAIDKESATIDANLERTEFDYDARGNLVQTRYPDGTSEITAYDEEGNVVAQTDRLGRTTRMIFDPANRIIETIYPDATPGNDLDNPRITNEYDPAGRLSAVIDERGNRTEYEYDGAGRRTLVRDALLNVTRFEYDARGLKTAMVDAQNRRTTYIYDDEERLIETIFPDDTPGDVSDNLRSSVGYDAVGRKTSETDLAGLTTTFEYDEVGNLTAVVDALSQRTEYGYDEQSNRITQTDAEIRTTQWSYDDAGRAISRTLPEGQSESFTYDGNGNRLTHTDFNGATHTFTYDAMNRELTASYADGVMVTTTYTNSGQVASVTDNRGTTSYSYDERDRLTRIDYPNGRWIGYGYDAAGNRTSLTTTNQSVDYTFDVLNRLSTVTDEAGVTTYGYDAVGNRASVDYANGARTEYLYDPLNRLTQLDQLDALNALFDRHSYVLGPNGNRTQHAELNGRVVDYTYDDLYRLTNEAVTDPTLGSRSSAWTYDAVGNRLTQTETDAGGTTTTTYTYDDNDRLLTETAIGADPLANTYTYDDNGNTLTRSDGASTTTYTYDSRNRLSDLNAGQVTYVYDASGIRMSEAAAGLTTNYLVDPNREYAQVVEESLDLNAFSDVRYTYGDDLVAQHRRIDATTTNSSTYHYDGIGSTRQLTDVEGAVTDTYVFEAFGELENSTGFTTNRYLFTGEQFDPNLGFYYLRARYYSPVIGRFSTMDSFPGVMFEPMTLHRYLYGNGNPANVIDPSGNFGISDVVGAVRVAGIQAVQATVRFGSKIAGGPIGRAIKASGAAAINRIVRREVRRCWRSRGKRCRIPNMVVIGSALHPDSQQHIRDASVGRGSNQIPIPLLLTYKRGANRSRYWLGRTKECAGLTGGITGKDCDEYPFATTTRGGKRGYDRRQVSLRPIDSWDNQDAGRVWGRAVRRGKNRAKYLIVPFGPVSFYYSHGKFGI